MTDFTYQLVFEEPKLRFQKQVNSKVFKIYKTFIPPYNQATFQSLKIEKHRHILLVQLRKHRGKSPHVTDSLQIWLKISCRIDRNLTKIEITNPHQRFKPYAMCQKIIFKLVLIKKLGCIEWEGV